MKTLCLAAILAMGAAASAQKLELKLDHLASRSAETVDVTLDSSMLQLAGKFLSDKEPDEAKVKKMLAGLKGIYVRSFEFKKENEYSKSDVDAVRAQLKAPAWSRIMNFSSTRDGEAAEIYLCKEGDKISGVAIIAAEPKELTVVNIVGPIDLESLSDLGGHFGVPEIKPKAKQ